jgi:voltage-gated potassium channel
MEFALIYLRHFAEHLVFAWPLLACQALIIIVLGSIVGVLESWKHSDSIYWAFITATTVGYGDIRPLRGASRLLAVVIALIGVTFTGLLVALAINAATLTLADKPIPDRASAIGQPIPQSYLGFG